MKKLILTAILSMLVAMAARAADIKVEGTVLSAVDEEPLIGATVMAEGSSVGTATDIDGNFSLTVPEGSTLVVSYVGFATKKEKAAPRMRILLNEDSEVLNEVVVVGYSTQKKVDVTGAITAVNVSEIEKQNENNPIKAMQGLSLIHI